MPRRSASASWLFTAAVSRRDSEPEVTGTACRCGWSGTSTTASPAEYALRHRLEVDGQPFARFAMCSLSTAVAWLICPSTRCASR